MRGGLFEEHAFEFTTPEFSSPKLHCLRYGCKRSFSSEFSQIRRFIRKQD